MKPWYAYLPSSDFGTNPPTANAICDIRKFNVLPGTNQATDVPLVLVAILDDLLRIAGLVAVGFVIVGAIQYITSQGDPEGTGRAQSTVINALIGLAITVIAVAFVGFLGNKLGG